MRPAASVRLASAILAGTCLLSSGCTRIFFFPSKRDFTLVRPIPGRSERINFTAPDGVALSGIWLYADKQPAKAVVVHFHGNAENATTHYMFAQWLTHYGFDVFTFDYRGYGSSAGHPSVAGAVRDGQAAIEYARSRMPSGKVLVFAQSLGASLAVVALARMRCAPVWAVALEGPFSSYVRIARDKMGLLPVISLVRWPFSWLFWTRYEPARYVGRISPRPLLIIYGEKDNIIPAEESVRLFAAAGEPKERWILPESEHTQTFTRFAAIYRPRLVHFFLAALEKPEPCSAGTGSPQER